MNAPACFSPRISSVFGYDRPESIACYMIPGHEYKRAVGGNINIIRKKMACIKNPYISGYGVIDMDFFRTIKDIDIVPAGRQGGNEIPPPGKKAAFLGKELAGVFLQAVQGQRSGKIAPNVHKINAVHVSENAVKP